jgi:hypothetical protein
LADHIVVILPALYPDASFLATAEVGSGISIYSVEWATSLSAFMHELAHNIGVRHSKAAFSFAPLSYASSSSNPEDDDDDDDEYGDSTGYMGRSEPVAWVPRKCYNAAQHWALGWYEPHLRLSLAEPTATTTTSDAPVLPIRITVAAFVDYAKISVDDDTSMVVLVQLNDSSVYLQFNRAKDYNIGTDMLQDQVVIVQDEEENTLLLAGLDMDNDVYTVQTDNVSVQVRVCEIVIAADDPSAIDYAVIVVGNGALCDDSSPEYESLAPPPPLDDDQAAGVDESVASPYEVAPTGVPTVAPTGVPTLVPTTVITTQAPSLTPITVQPTLVAITNFPTTPPASTVSVVTNTPSPTATMVVTASPVLLSTTTASPTVQNLYGLSTTPTTTTNGDGTTVVDVVPAAAPSLLTAPPTIAIVGERPNSSTTASPTIRDRSTATGATGDDSAAASPSSSRSPLAPTLFSVGAFLVVAVLAMAMALMYRRRHRSGDPDTFWQQLRSRSDKQNKGRRIRGASSSSTQLHVYPAREDEEVEKDHYHHSVNGANDHGIHSWPRQSTRAGSAAAIASTAADKEVSSNGAWSPSWAEMYEESEDGSLSDVLEKDIRKKGFS